MEIFESGDLRVDLTNRAVLVKGKRINLAPMEYSLLRLFVQNAGKVLTHRQITDEIWGSDQPDKHRILRVYISYLRTKLETDPAEPNLLVTEPGIGYRLALQE
jgi:two-component system KDP operon response regulator KdpE